MPRPARPSRPAPEPDAAGPSAAWPAFVGLLLTCRCLQPTEAAVFGETLWQAQLWLTAAAVWCWRSARSGRTPLRWSLLDAFLWLLVLGHALSTLPVFLQGGDRRAAVNIVWEWAGLAAMVFLVRQVFNETELRRPARLFAATAVGLAALGIWQHHVSFPENAAKYRTLRAEEETLSSRDSTADHARLTEVRRELAGFGSPTDPGGRKRWEDRLLSTEPFATFGLANTLGGLLAAAIPLVLVSLTKTRRPAVIAGLAASVGTLLYCLLLTKSRTAWVGLAAAAVVAGGLNFARAQLSRRAILIAIAAACGVVLLGLVGLATGGIDREVFGEAPKSLRYRLDYWTGALRVLAERPLLGTGPGNFRPYYLEHRPAGASEEIAAPHHLFLDVWTAGGLISLVALVGMLSYCGYRFLSPAAVRSNASEATWGPAEWGFIAAFPLSMFALFLAGQGIDGRVAAVGLVAAAALWSLTRSNAGPLLVVGTGAGFCALAVHLLGADGIEFPAVVQTLIILALSADIPRPATARLAVGIAPAVGLGLLAVACLLTATAPVLNAGALTERADALIEHDDPSVDRVLAQAKAADPLGTRAPLLRAELATSRALGTGSESDFETARRRWEAFLAEQPRDIHARRRLAELLTVRGRRSSDAADFEAAARRLAEAVGLSPTDVTLRVDLARAWAAAGHADAAREQAREALKLDDLNRQAWHADLVFSPETLAEMRRLAGVGNTQAEP